MIFKVESFTVRVVNVEGKTLYINELFFFMLSGTGHGKYRVDKEKFVKLSVPVHHCGEV